MFGYTRDKSLVTENIDDWQEAEDQFGIYWNKHPKMPMPIPPEQRKKYSKKEAQEAGCVSAEQCQIASHIGCTLADVFERCGVHHQISRTKREAAETIQKP